MSNTPEGAQLSDDGQWWWDGENWQPVDTSGGGATPSEVAGQGCAGVRFRQQRTAHRLREFAGAACGRALKPLLDLQHGHCRGQAHVTLKIDGQDRRDVGFAVARAGQCTAPDGDGYVHGCRDKARVVTPSRARRHLRARSALGYQHDRHRCAELTIGRQ